MAKWHRLKTWPPYFEATLRGDKGFELRFNDRGFKIGDYLILEEWDPKTKKYSGRVLSRTIVYMLSGAFGLPENQIILQTRKV